MGLQILCTLVFGKNEDGGGFEITQKLVDGAVTQLKEQLTGEVKAWLVKLPAHFLRPLVYLCISGASVFIEAGALLS